MDRSPTTGPVSDRQRNCPPKAAIVNPTTPSGNSSFASRSCTWHPAESAMRG